MVSFDGYNNPRFRLSRPGESLGEALPDTRSGRGGYGDGQVPPPPGAASYEAYRNAYEE